MKKCLLFILSVVGTVLYGQQKIESYIKLDSVIDTGIKCDYEDIVPDNIKLKILDKKLWLFYPNWNDNDSIHFEVVDLKTKKQNKVQIYLPGITFKTSNPNIAAFDVTDSALVILFTDNKFAFYKKKKDNYIFQYIEPVAFSYSNIYILTSNKLLFVNLYNSHPLANHDPVVFCLYDINRKKLDTTLIPKFDYIEFSHFSPFHWLEVSNNEILLSQTGKYQLNFYDNLLEKKETILNDEKDWTNVDSNFVKKLRSTSPRIGAKNLIEMLSPMEDTVSRIEAVYRINKNTMLVRKIPSYNKQKNRLREYDVWNKDKRNKWQLKKENIIDAKHNVDEICDKNNFPVLSVFDNVTFGENYYVKVSPRFSREKFGETYKQIKDEEEKQVGTKTPEFYLYIYSIDL